MFSVVDLSHWLLLAAPPELPTMLAGRFLAGVAGGGYSPNIQIYVAEISLALESIHQLGFIHRLVYSQK